MRPCVCGMTILCLCLCAACSRTVEIPVPHPVRVTPPAHLLTPTPEPLECGLGSRGGLQQLRQKDGALLKAIAYSVQRRDQRGVDDIQRLTHRQGSIGGGTGLCL